MLKYNGTHQHGIMVAVLIKTDIKANTSMGPLRLVSHRELFGDSGGGYNENKHSLGGAYWFRG